MIGENRKKQKQKQKGDVVHQRKTAISNNPTLLFITLRSVQAAAALAATAATAVGASARRLLQYIFNLLPVWTEGPTLVH